jgi:NAD(P)-dependent dehydrogenase (short-subunit alcohol dehydrogenase family)
LDPLHFTGSSTVHKGVRVNGVAPEPTTTPGTDAMGAGFTAIVWTILLGRAADAEEIAEAIVFLASGRVPKTAKRLTTPSRNICPTG